MIHKINQKPDIRKIFPLVTQVRTLEEQNLMFRIPQVAKVTADLSHSVLLPGSAFGFCVMPGVD